MPNAMEPEHLYVERAKAPVLSLDRQAPGASALRIRFYIAGGKPRGA